MTSAQQFFYDSGYSYARGDESQEQARVRWSNELADAEQWAADHGVTFKWVPDEGADPMDWDGEGAIGKYAEGCIMICASGGTLEIQGIWDADDNYRRVVQAELASEAMGRCVCERRKA